MFFFIVNKWKVVSRGACLHSSFATIHQKVVGRLLEEEKALHLVEFSTPLFSPTAQPPLTSETLFSMGRCVRGSDRLYNRKLRKIKRCKIILFVAKLT